MDPAAELAEILAEADGMPEGLNVYPYPVEQLVTPALVIRPDMPWIEPSRFCADDEHYLVIAAVPAAAPADGIALLRSMALAMMAALQPPWEWLNTDGPVIDQTTGVPYLANRSRLTFHNPGGEES